MIDLEIRFDGNVPGLAEHRLSIGSFAKPLKLLLTAARRTANNMIRESGERKEAGVGRLLAEADQIDIQIASLSEGSTIPSCVVTAIPALSQQSNLYAETLAEDAIDRLLSHIERESEGIPRSKWVREYLRELPFGLTSQDYILRVDGIVKREVHVGLMSISSLLTETPYLKQIVGKVIGVGFEPGRHVVKIKSSDADGAETTLTATKKQVDTALEIRSSQVRIVAVVSAGTQRLLRIQEARETPVKLQDSHIFVKWEELLGRLAQ